MRFKTDMSPGALRTLEKIETKAMQSAGAAMDRRPRTAATITDDEVGLTILLFPVTEGRIDGVEQFEDFEKWGDSESVAVTRLLITLPNGWVQTHEVLGSTPVLVYDTAPIRPGRKLPPGVRSSFNRNTGRWESVQFPVETPVEMMQSAAKEAARLEAPQATLITHTPIASAEAAN